MFWMSFLGVFAVYPKVKVREDFKDDDETLNDKKNSPRSPVLGLKAIDFLSIYDSNTLVQKHQVFRRCIARTSKTCISQPLKEIDSVGTNETVSDENNKSNIRASSIPRPRAVLSSPDNDAMIGKTNRRSVDRPSVLKNHNKSQQRSPHVVNSASNDAVHVVTPGIRKTKESADSQSTQKQKDRSASLAMRQKRTHIQTGKANAVRF